MFKGWHLDGEQGVGWGESQFFEALILEQIQSLVYITASANSEKGKAPKKPPDKIAIPGREKAEKRQGQNTFATTLASMFAQGHQHLAHTRN